MRFLQPSIQYITTADMAGLLDTTSKTQQEEKNESINKSKHLRRHRAAIVLPQLPLPLPLLAPPNL